MYFLYVWTFDYKLYIKWYILYLGAYCIAAYEYVTDNLSPSQKRYIFLKLMIEQFRKHFVDVQTHKRIRTVYVYVFIYDLNKWHLHRLSNINVNSTQGICDIPTLFSIFSSAAPVLEIYTYLCFLPWKTNWQTFHTKGKQWMLSTNPFGISDRQTQTDIHPSIHLSIHTRSSSSKPSMSLNASLPRCL